MVERSARLRRALTAFPSALKALTATRGRGEDARSAGVDLAQGGLPIEGGFVGADGDDAGGRYGVVGGDDALFAADKASGDGDGAFNAAAPLIDPRRQGSGVAESVVKSAVTSAAGSPLARDAIAASKPASVAGGGFTSVENQGQIAASGPGRYGVDLTQGAGFSLGAASLPASAVGDPDATPAKPPS